MMITINIYSDNLGSMPFTYFDVAALLFGEAEFSASEFARRSANPRAAKVLSELKRRGLVARVGRGRYRCLRPGERPDRRADEWARVRGIILDAPLAKAWTGPTAVEVWTEGRYSVGPSVFIREFHLRVPEGLLGEWRAYLAEHGVPTHPRKRIGPRVVLEPVKRLDGTTFHDEPVIPRSEVVRMIRAKPATYANAEGLLAD